MGPVHGWGFGQVCGTGGEGTWRLSLLTKEWLWLWILGSGWERGVQQERAMGRATGDARVDVVAVRKQEGRRGVGVSEAGLLGCCRDAELK